MSDAEHQQEQQPTELQPVAEPTSNALPAADDEPAKHEPIEGGSGADADAAKAGDGLVTNVTPTIFAALSFVALVLFVIATPLPWLRRDLGSRVFVSLWSKEVTTTSSVVVQHVSDFACAEERKYFRAAESFAIITIFFALLTFVAGLAARARAASTKPLCTALAFVTVATGVVCWSIGVAAYRKQFCGQATYDEQRYFIYTGPSVFVAGWVLTAAALAVSLKDIRVPAVVPQAAVDRLIFAVFTVVAFLAFLFAVVSTPIPIVSQWMAANVEYRVSIWHLYIYTDGVMTTKTSLYELSCGTLFRYAKLTQAFTVSSIFTCLFAFVAGVLALRGVGGYKAVIPTGILATATALIATSVDLAIYFKDFCTALQSFDTMHFHRDAGVALIATSAVTMAAVTLVAIASVAVQLVRSKPASGNVSKGSFAFLVGAIVAVLFLVVALATPVYQREVSAVEWDKVYWWETQSLSSPRLFTKADFTCEKTWQRLVGGASITIAAIAVLAIGALLGIGQFVNRSLAVPATAAAMLSAVLQLIAFALAIDAWRTTYCGVNFKKAGFAYDIGFALVPSAFCVTVVVALLNLFLAA